MWQYGFPILLIISNTVFFYKLRKWNIETTPVSKVLFFREESLTCKSHTEVKPYTIFCTLPTCQFSYITHILNNINSSKKSLDIVLYMMTIKSLADAIIRAQRRGVKVRFIADETMANSSGSKVRFLQCAGIPVRSRPSIYLMHHKFAIVDDYLLMTGSFNWTLQAAIGNWDNMIITTEIDYVRSHKQEFNRLWDDLGIFLNEEYGATIQ
uniref:Mitochondrial cardiolipin hydrolase n=1 Tax=Clastoptera arizonana TaxID=38151 RepID=A0A1B6C9T7_9HEMI